ncbi:MAG: hypothetical protein HYZ29_08090 [Myxococcales bacterium]|nr:hypothetical protein [Myxococcales bacterium]
MKTRLSRTYSSSAAVERTITCSRGLVLALLVGVSTVGCGTAEGTRGGDLGERDLGDGDQSLVAAKAGPKTDAGNGKPSPDAGPADGGGPQLGCGPSVDCDDNNPCTADKCTAGVGCVHQPALGACDDGKPNTVDDMCSNGVCAGVDHCLGVVCAALDQCHQPGQCDHATGVCSNPVVEDGTACNDANACTLTDTCQAGECAGGSPVVCVALDQCHGAGQCSPASGACSNPRLADGVACNDGNACTLTDTCQTGECAGGNPVVCVALDQCHTAGTCDPTSGVCDAPASQDGNSCDDGNASTVHDSCSGGNCAGIDLCTGVVCAAPDQCHEPGECNPADGHCSYPARPDALPCDDGNACTQSDACQAGSCVGAESVTCTALDQCHAVGACDPVTGVCSNPVASDGTGCSDEDVCNGAESCRSGVCVNTTDHCHADAARDFSASRNPRGNWSYGQTLAPGGAFELFDTAAGGPGWLGWRSGASTSALVFHNGTPATQLPWGTVNLGPGMLAMHPGEYGRYAVVRWTATTGGHYRLNGAFTGISTAWPTTTDVAVLRGGTSIFAGGININGLGASAPFDLTVSLAAGESVDWVVGYGNGSYYYDSTALDAHVTSLDPRCTDDALECDDRNSCSVDMCDAVSGCVNLQMVNGSACDDGNVCTPVDSCQAGACSGTTSVGCTP